ncbi:MAG: Maf family protein [Planctomycetota bacterium]
MAETLTDKPDPKPKLWLASRSPRRRQLLDEAGLAHEAGHPGFEDGDLRPGQVTPGQWVAALAYLKAAAGREHAIDGRIVLGADTAIVKDGTLIGTPRDAAEASAILHRLSNGHHQVLSGVSLISPCGRRLLFVDSATVFMGEIGDERIREYVASGQWQGKAGGYNLRERLASGWPIRFEGDPTTIMGLPMRALLTRLRAFRNVVEGSLAGDAA